MMDAEDWFFTISMALCGLMACAAFGAGMGEHYTEERMQIRAIEAGVAEYFVDDEDHKTYFRYKAAN